MHGRRFGGCIAGCTLLLPGTTSCTTQPLQQCSSTQLYTALHRWRTALHGSKQRRRTLATSSVGMASLSSLALASTLVFTSSGTWRAGREGQRGRGR